MAQADYVIEANPPGLAFRTENNAINKAIQTQNSGATAPTSTEPFMPWADTSNASRHYLKIRNPNNDAWNILFEYNIADDYLTTHAGVTEVGTIAKLRAMTQAPRRVWVSGYHTKGDGAFGSNIFEWDSTSVEADNGGTIIKLFGTTIGRYKLKYSGAVNIKWFGVVGDWNGTTGTNESTLIQNALDYARDNNIKKVVFPFTTGSYLMNDVTVHQGIELEGIGRLRVYNPSSTPDVINNCTLVFDTDGTDFITWGGDNFVQNINFYGVDKSVPMISNASDGRLFFFNCSSSGFIVGFGKQFGGGTLGSSWFNRCHASQNNYGFRSLVDSHVLNCEMNANTLDGAYQPTGANDTEWIGNKVEFNEINGFNFFQAEDNSITGGIVDRNYEYGIKVIQTEVIVSNTQMTRNGRDFNVLGGSHFYGESAKFILSNIKTKTGADDGGSGDITPDYCISIGGTTSLSEVHVSNSDLTGFTIQALDIGDAKLVSTNNKGIQDKTKLFDEGTTVLSGNTFVSQLDYLQDIQQMSIFDMYSYEVDVIIENVTSAVNYFARFIVLLSVTSSTTADIQSYKVVGDSAVDLTGATKMNIIPNISSDSGGSFIRIVAQATSNDDMNITIKTNTK